MKKCLHLFMFISVWSKIKIIKYVELLICVKLWIFWINKIHILDQCRSLTAYRDAHPVDTLWQWSPHLTQLLLCILTYLLTYLLHELHPCWPIVNTLLFSGSLSVCPYVCLSVCNGSQKRHKSSNCWIDFNENWSEMNYQETTKMTFHRRE